MVENRPALWAEKLGVGDRCQYVAGDMFVDVPPADAYLMKMVLHDWNDEECIQILKVIHHLVSPNGRIFLAEYVIPNIDTPHFSKLFDIHMLCWGTGQERTTEQYAALLQSAGWRFEAGWLPSSGTIRVIEGVKV